MIIVRINNNLSNKKNTYALGETPGRKLFAEKRILGLKKADFFDKMEKIFLITGGKFMSEKILILDFGGQYNQLIARRVRECNVYCEIKSYKMTVEEIKAYDPMGIIFTGGPNSVYLETSPHVDPAVFELGIPILGICYGCQLMAHTLGGLVTEAQEDSAREYGKTQTFFDTTC